METQHSERQQNLIILFQRASQTMVAELVTRVEDAGYGDIRPAHSRVFETLDPAGSRISDMAERAQMAHQSMSELVDGLETLGYVERQPDPDDGRAKLICLTPRGRELLRRAIEEIGSIEAEWLRRLEQAGVEGDLLQALDEVLRTVTV